MPPSSDTPALTASGQRVIRGHLKPVRSRHVDDVMVDRLLAGIWTGRMPTAYEIRRAVVILTVKGWSARQIAVHLRCTDRTVTRHRSAVRLRRIA